MRSRATVLVPAAVVALAAAPASAPADIADRLDEPAAEIECAKWEAGQPTQIAKLRGRVVVLHFSDPDRITSQAAVPTMKKLAAAWKDAPVTIVEVVTSSTETAAAAYASKELPPWAVGWDAKGASSGRYPGDSIPRTYLIGPDGRIVWHAHVQALTKDLVQAQVSRVQFFAPGPDVKRAKSAARLASEMKFGAALHEGEKVEADRLSTDADRALVQAIRADVARTYEFDKKLLETLVKDCDWGLAWRRVQRMKAVFAGTEYEAKANADIARLEANPVVAYVRPAQDQYDALIDQYAKARTKKDVESLLTAVRNFADRYVNTKPGDRAAQWIPAIEKRLAELSAK